MVDLLAGDHADLLALGLVAQVLWCRTGDAGTAHRQTVARARLEPVFGRERLDQGAAAAWAAASESALETHPDRPAVLDTAERVLGDAGAIELAELSEYLPRGFELRVAALGRGLAAGDLDAAAAAVERLRAHRHARRRSHRVQMAEAAVRLLRRSKVSPAPPPTTFAAAIVYKTLRDNTDGQRRQSSAQFAELLVEWSRAEPLEDLAWCRSSSSWPWCSPRSRPQRPPC